MFVLFRCSNGNNTDQPDGNNNSPVDNNSQEVNDNNGDTTENDGVTNEDGENSNASSNNADAVNNDHLKEFDEYEVLAKELDLDVYEGVVESDNKGNRIILFQTKDDKKEYKSIFVKNNHRLKIVHFDDEDDLLYNDVIQ